MTTLCATHTEHLAAMAARLDPDRLADRVRAALRTGVVDDSDVDMVMFGPGRELAVDVITGETWEGEWTRTPDQQLRLALIHLAAALAAGARI